MNRVKFEVTGKVQGKQLNWAQVTVGVFFRAYAVKKANSLGVTGWIRNTERDSVEGEAQQQKPKLDEFVKVWVNLGNFLMESG